MNAGSVGRDGQRTAGWGETLRWLKNTVETAEDECCDWPFHLDKAGYPYMSYEGRRRNACQVALILTGQPQPARGIGALHSCDRPPCINPSHLRWGNDAENVADQIERGRNSPPPKHSGETHPQAKLTVTQVADIRASSESQRALARRYGVAQRTIWNIIHERIWKS